LKIKSIFLTSIPKKYTGKLRSIYANKIQKKSFFIVIILSTLVYPNCFLDEENNQVITSVDIVKTEIARLQKTEENNQSLPKPSIKLEQEKLDRFLDDVSQTSKKFVQDIFETGRIRCSEQLSRLRYQDSLELKINKVGLGAGSVAMATVLGFNRVTKPGPIRNKLIFKRLLGFGSDYVIYKLVVTNDVVKKDICDTLAKIKKD
jgi:hypothetical protein